MARLIHNKTIESRSNRLKLPVARKPVFVRIGDGLSLGYRRNKLNGTWVVRIADGKGSSTTKSIGLADDYNDADNSKFFDYFQAQEQARDYVRRLFDRKERIITIRLAVENYLKSLEAKNSRTAYDTRLRLNRLFVPKFGDVRIIDLTKTALEQWLYSLVTLSDNPEEIRKSKDTANRVLTMAKAALNYAFRDGANGIVDDTAWRLVKPFGRVSQPRSTRYTDDEVKKLIANAPDQATANLIKAAFLTGARYGELTDAKIKNLDLRSKSWLVSGKTGSRTVLLQKSAVEFFTDIIDGRTADEFIFLRSNGQKWKKSEQTRPFKEAMKTAGLSEDGCLYCLRHTYISKAIEGGVPLTVIATNTGTSIRMIEKTYAKVLAEKQQDFIEKGAPSLK